MKGRMYEENGECYFTASFVIFGDQKNKLFITYLKEKDFWVEQSEEGTEINWAINFAAVCWVLMLELGGLCTFHFQLK